MDVAASDVPVNLGSVATTSVVEENKKDRDDNIEEESVDPPTKKRRFDERASKVAEIILVLSAFRKIRGGENPTEFEIELMVEAKSILVDMCQEFSPNDLVSRDAVRALIEDLGLSDKLKDQRLGIRTPKLTISEKLALVERKMEESKKNPIVSSASQGHSTYENYVSGAHLWSNSKMKAPVSSVNATESQTIRDASGITQSRIERPRILASQGPAEVPVGNYSRNATTSFGTASDSKVPVQGSSRVTDPSIRPFMSQAPPVTFPDMRGESYGQTSSSFANNPHAEIAESVQKVLQPQAIKTLSHSWDPPSGEYMSRATICPICKETAKEVKTVLICDFCEEGYHLKCLQGHNMEGFRTLAWRCSRCVRSHRGMPIPLRYGRVVKNDTTEKMFSSTAEEQFRTEKKVGKMVQKVNQEAMTTHPETAKPTDQDLAMEQTAETEDEDQNPLVEYSLQEEDSASQTENLTTHSPSSQSNTYHSKQQNATPNVEEATQENVTETPDRKTEAVNIQTEAI